MIALARFVCNLLSETKSSFILEMLRRIILDHWRVLNLQTTNQLEASSTSITFQFIPMASYLPAIHKYPSTRTEYRLTPRRMHDVILHDIIRRSSLLLHIYPALDPVSSPRPMAQPRPALASAIKCASGLIECCRLNRLLRFWFFFFSPFFLRMQEIIVKKSRSRNYVEPHR